MSNPLQEVKDLRERAAAEEKAGRFLAAADACDLLAKAWLRASGLALTQGEQQYRIELAKAAKEKAGQLRGMAEKEPVAVGGSAPAGKPSGTRGLSHRDEDKGAQGGRAAETQTETEGEIPESEFLVAEKPTETLDDIMGMAEAKQAVQDFLDIIKDPEGARKFNLKASSGLLLYGPPGNGKTMFGKAIANHVDAPFYYASGATIRSKYVGESSQRLHALFQYARKKEMAVIFFDEIETLIPKRGENTHPADAQIVTQFLQEVGGFVGGANRIMLLGATNCPWDIDYAAFRTGRFDLKIFIGAPDAEARLGMLQRAFKGVELEPAVDLGAWAMRLENYTGSDIAGLAEIARKAAFRRYRADHSEQSVRESDMEDALKQVTKSITPELMQKFEEFAKSRE